MNYIEVVAEHLPPRRWRYRSARWSGVGEGGAVAAATDAIARQPESRRHDIADAVRRPGDDRNHGDLCLVVALFANPFIH